MLVTKRYLPVDHGEIFLFFVFVFFFFFGPGSLKLCSFVVPGVVFDGAKKKMEESCPMGNPSNSGFEV